VPVPVLGMYPAMRSNPLMTAGMTPSYTAVVVDEPVRGGFPDPSFYAQAGIDQARAWQQERAPRVPLSHLTGIRPTQVRAGAVTLTMPASPWLATQEGAINVEILIQDALEFAVLTDLPPAHEIRTASLVYSRMRGASVESENFVARANTVYGGRTFTLAEVFVEDAKGRGIAHGSASFILRPVGPPDVPSGPQPNTYDAPVYASPDPYLRPGPRPSLDYEGMGGLAVVLAHGDDEQATPLQQLLGIRLLDADEGTTLWSMAASEWLCGRVRQVSPGVISVFASYGAGYAPYTVMPAGYRLSVLDHGVTFFRPVLPDGSELVARGVVSHEGDGLYLSSAEVTDAAGNAVAVSRRTSRFTPRQPTPPGLQPDRVLATVLFTDIVGSTEAAARLADARWRETLERHHVLVRRQLELWKGREVKTTGDGFLATFDSPGRAVQCARAIRDGVRRLGIEIRVGLHAGECEITGADVAGIAVHIAARIQTLAAPGEILVSGTVRDLVTGSGLRFTDRGRHPLKGIEGDWAVFAVDG